jgi:hypothetical protein
LPIGVEVAWLGYPAIAEYTLCFFSGNVSAFQEFRNAYLIDGVAINGVSGGPVMYSTTADGVQIVGSITAYRANRATGETLPGLSIAQDVSHFQESVTRIRSIDEANQQRANTQQDQPAESAAATPPASPSPPSEPPESQRMYQPKVNSGLASNRDLGHRLQDTVVDSFGFGEPNRLLLGHSQGHRPASTWGAGFLVTWFVT